jgi:hypothetical protein
LLPPASETVPPPESTEDKTTRAYARMKKTAADRNRRRKVGLFQWEPKLQDAVLIRCQPQSDQSRGISAKFQRPYDGPWFITRIIPQAIYEVSDSLGRTRGTFHKKAIKPFITPDVQ